MSDPTNQFNLHHWIEAIVDDTSIFTNVDRDSTIDELIRTLETDAQSWDNLLSVSGGCLELSKCFYYVLAWTFTDKGEPIPMILQEIEVLSSQIRLQEFKKTEYTTIAAKPPQMPHKTFGVLKTMIDDDTTHLATLAKRSSNMASIVGTIGMILIKRTLHPE